MEQGYVPEVGRPRTQEEQDTLGREEGTKQGLTDPECLEGQFSELRLEGVLRSSKEKVLN